MTKDDSNRLSSLKQNLQITKLFNIIYYSGDKMNYEKDKMIKRIKNHKHTFEVVEMAYFNDKREFRLELLTRCEYKGIDS